MLSRQRHGATEGRRGGLLLLLEEAEAEAEAARRRRLQGNLIPPILGSLRALALAHCVEAFPAVAEVQAQGRAQAAAAEECHQHGDQVQKYLLFSSLSCNLRFDGAPFRVLGREFMLCVRPAIVLPEQSMASERAGMAVNKRGLTLRELLQQTAHYNANVRRGELPLVGTVTHQIN